MQYFVVEVTEDETEVEDDAPSMQLNSEEYQEFVETAREQRVFDDLLEESEFSCKRCKAYTVPAKVFCAVIADRVTLDCAYDIIHGVTERVYLTEAEWTAYVNHGGASVAHLKGAEIIEMDGDLYRLIADEIFFRFDDSCECGRLLQAADA